MSAEKPWLLVRVELKTPAGAAVRLGPVIIDGGRDDDDPLVLQVPIFGESHLADGWPADPSAFGAAIFNARQSRRWSMATLARRARVAELTVRNTEKGTRNVSPQVRQLLIAALALPTNPRAKESPDDEPNTSPHPEQAPQAKAQPGENVGQTSPPKLKKPSRRDSGVR